MLIAIYKSGAKLHKIFDIRKDLHKKTHPKMRFFSTRVSVLRASRDRFACTSSRRTYSTSYNRQVS